MHGFGNVYGSFEAMAAGTGSLAQDSIQMNDRSSQFPELDGMLDFAESWAKSNIGNPDWQTVREEGSEIVRKIEKYEYNWHIHRGSNPILYQRINEVVSQVNRVIDQ